MPYCGKTKSEKLLSVFSFLLLPPSCGPKNVNIFYRNSSIFHRFDFSSTISLTNGCAFHYLWDHKVFGGQSGGEISAGHLADLRKRLSKVHCALFLVHLRFPVWFVMPVKHYTLMAHQHNECTTSVRTMTLMSGGITSSPSYLRHWWTLVFRKHLRVSILCCMWVVIYYNDVYSFKSLF